MRQSAVRARHCATTLRDLFQQVCLKSSARTFRPARLEVGVPHGLLQIRVPPVVLGHRTRLDQCATLRATLRLSHPDHLPRATTASHRSITKDCKARKRTADEGLVAKHRPSHTSFGGENPAFVSPISWIRAPYDDRQPRSLESESRPTSILGGGAICPFGGGMRDKIRSAGFRVRRSYRREILPILNGRDHSSILVRFHPKGPIYANTPTSQGLDRARRAWTWWYPDGSEKSHTGAVRTRRYCWGPQIPLSASRAGPARATLPRVARAALPLRAFEVVSWTVSGAFVIDFGVLATDQRIWWS